VNDKAIAGVYARENDHISDRTTISYDIFPPEHPSYRQAGFSGWFIAFNINLQLDTRQHTILQLPISNYCPLLLGFRLCKGISPFIANTYHNSEIPLFRKFPL
jgi:hypothetical protein